LEKQSADPCCADSSNNTAVHYAAAYGWMECLKLLLECGADPNASNDWKTTPLSAAMQKGHMAIADYLLGLDSVDINVGDDEGRTLLSHIMETVTEATLNQFRYLLDKRKDADVTIADAQGFTPLHYLCKNYNPHDKSNSAYDEDQEEEGDKKENEEEEYSESKKEKKEKEKEGRAFKQIGVAIAKELIARGADVNALSKVFPSNRCTMMDIRAKSRLVSTGQGNTAVSRYTELQRRAGHLLARARCPGVIFLSRGFLLRIFFLQKVTAYSPITRTRDRTFCTS